MEQDIFNQEHSVPGSLSEARQRLLRLPGIENFVPDPSLSQAEIDQGLEKAISDLNKQLDAESSVVFITQALALTKNESEEFFSHPERRPYKSTIELSEDRDEQIKQLLAVGTYLRFRYESDDSVARAQDLAEFLGNSTLFLFGRDTGALDDEINGVTGRGTGTKPSQEMQSLMRRITDELASKNGVDSESLHEQVLEATEGGNYETAILFLTNRQGDLNVREALQSLVETRRNDKKLARRKLKLLWQIEKYRLSMAVNLDALYEANLLPDVGKVKEILHEFLTNDANTAEMLDHLQREAPQALSESQATGTPIDFWKMLAEMAKYQGFPDSAESPQELQQKKKKVWTEISEYLPSMAFEDSTRSFVDTPTRIGTQTRDYNVTYQNINDQLVNVSLINPRGKESRLAARTAHEMGHKLHARILKAAESADYVDEGSWDTMFPTVKEEFSQLLEDQVAKLYERRSAESIAKADKGEQKGQWRDLLHAFLIRRLGSYALIQTEVRLNMQKLWNEGKRGVLTDEETDKIIDELSPKVKEYYSLGVPITSPNQTITNNINLDNPLDGLVYLLGYIKKGAGKDTPQETKFVGIKEAFSTRFGEVWIDNADARAVLLALMGESGRNQEIETYAKFIEGTSEDEAFSRLESWGIKGEEI